MKIKTLIKRLRRVLSGQNEVEIQEIKEKLESLDLLVDEINELAFKANYEIETESPPLINISEDVYDELCRCIGKENMNFMGIS